MPRDIKSFTDNLDLDLSAMYHEEDKEVDESIIYPLSSSLKNKLVYKEEEEVARGGEKKIFKAYDARSDRYIAMARPLRDSREYEERFLREARICARLEHPNIIPVYDIELDEFDKPYFTMELLKGKTLKEVLENFDSDELRQSHLPQLLDIFVKVCDALSYAHSKNVLHLDIKPENINVGEFGQVLLIDWGLAKIINDDSCDDLFLNSTDLDMDILNDMTRVGTLKGSPGFMAPEQAISNGEKSNQTDIYSLGALLYNILTGELHIKGNSVKDYLENTRKGELRSFDERGKISIPISLQAVFFKACKFESNQRYSSVEELKLEIQAFLRGYATQAEEAGFLKQLQLIYQRNRIRCQLIFGFLVIILMGTSIFIQALKERESEAILARDKAETALSLYEKEKRGRESIIAEFDNSLENFKDNLGSSSEVDSHFSRLLVGSAISSSRKLDFEMALALTELAIKKNPRDYNAIAEKGFVHMIRHEFSKANAALQRCSTHSPHIYDIIRIAREYSLIKPNDEQSLTQEQFIKLIQELPANRSWLKGYMIIYNRQVNPSLINHSEIVKGYLTIINLELKNKDINFKFEMKAEGNHLDLSNNKDLNFIKSMGGTEFPYKSILRTLDLKSLDLSNTNLIRIRNLKDLELKELNIANTPVKNFQVLDEFRVKPILYVSRSQDLSNCPKDVEVIYTD